MSRLVLSPQERAVASICTTFCVEWQFAEERKTLLGLLSLHLPHVRQGPPLIDLCVAAEQFLCAKTPVEWAFAKNAAARALVPVLAPDLMAPEGQRRRA